MGLFSTILEVCAVLPWPGASASRRYGQDPTGQHSWTRKAVLHADTTLTGLRQRVQTSSVFWAAEPVSRAILNEKSLWPLHSTSKDRASLQWHLIRKCNSRTFRLWIATTSPALYATRPFSAKR